MRKAELILIPLPAIGHLVSMVELAKLLHTQYKHLSITIILLRLPLDTKAFTYIESITGSGITFINLPVAEPPELISSSSKQQEGINPFSVLTKQIENHKVHVKEAVDEIIESEGFTRIVGFVVDMFCSEMIDVANEFEVPTYFFYTSGGGVLGLRFHVLSLIDEFNEDVRKYEDSEILISVPGFNHPVPVKLWPSPFFDMSGMIFNHTRRFKEAKGILINTFLDLESHAIEALSSNKNIPPVYPVGPIINIKDLPNSNTRDNIMKWLDDQPPSSVIFLCFGSMGSFDKEQVKEIAEALEQSGHRFLWSLRQPTGEGLRKYPSEYEDLEDVLPEGFLRRTSGIGKVIGWAPQVEIMSNTSVGGFVSHCGWNSILESVWFGVPMAAWPMYAEQQINAFQAVKEIGFAVEIKMDYRKNLSGKRSVIVKASEIEDGIRKLMEPESEVRKKVKELKEKCRIALMDGGPSSTSLGSFIEDLHLDQ